MEAGGAVEERANGKPPAEGPRGALVQVRFSSRKTASSAGDAFLISMKAEAPETKKKKHPRVGILDSYVDGALLWTRPACVPDCVC